MDRLSRNGPVRPSTGNAGADEARQPNPQTNTRRPVRRLNLTTTMTGRTTDSFDTYYDEITDEQYQMDAADDFPKLFAST